MPSGRSALGRRMQPWVFDGYAPAGAAVTTTADLAAVAVALLEERAPRNGGPGATRHRRRGGRQIGMFWQLSERDGRAVTWRNGRTGGYSAFLGRDRERGRARGRVGRRGHQPHLRPRMRPVR